MTVEDEWDFYSCRVDDAAASIFLNLWFAKVAPVPTAETLHWVRVLMRDAGEHGMGTSAEADAMQPLEDSLEEHARRAELLYVGRMRNNGAWQWAFYGPADRGDALAKHFTGLDGREIELGSKSDPGWDYYNEFLFPDPERFQWIQDRRVVDVLEEKGDALATPRRVDHWAYFHGADDRDAFVGAASREGFAAEPTHDEQGQFGAQVHRVDPVELDHIHGVVMQLVALAEVHGGDYDGWETSLERATASPAGGES